ncbi:amidohydrolase family protein [Beijerinckia sp. L45]|uniref:amidohydrolase family protein n=1 Tax=Beijerinckia sp. L45 TaxID=1641855 RepID=UPI00131E9E64|nr:amidohydrolase family protein [Beijerinckia sp. L45]
MNSKPFVVSLEEHYWDERCLGPISLAASAGSLEIGRRLANVGEERIQSMDEAGIDMQVLSHTGPSAQAFPKDIAVEKTRRLNDNLAETIARYPSRFLGFAALPTIDPEAAALELTRCVKTLGFKGGIVFGLTDGHFIDEKPFWPIFAAAANLNVPIYLHPAMPHPAVTAAYYADYENDFPMLTRAAWGFTVEAATQAVRLIVSGALQKYPGLRIILGHLGEGLPFLLWRIQNTLVSKQGVPVDIQNVFKTSFYLTTSGFFSTPALKYVIEEFGSDRVMFSVDYPFMSNTRATDWIRDAKISEPVRHQVMGGTAVRLLHIHP